MAPVIAIPVFEIFDKSLEAELLPGDWKCDNINPIFKKVASHLPTNYRFKSVAGVLIKMVKILVRKAIHSALDRCWIQPTTAWFSAVSIMSAELVECSSGIRSSSSI